MNNKKFFTYSGEMRVTKVASLIQSMENTEITENDEIILFLYVTDGYLEAADMISNFLKKLPNLITIITLGKVHSAGSIFLLQMMDYAKIEVTMSSSLMLKGATPIKNNRIKYFIKTYITKDESYINKGERIARVNKRIYDLAKKSDMPKDKLKEFADTGQTFLSNEEMKKLFFGGF